MAKRMLIDATHSEETRVVVLSGNRLEDFDFETSTKKQLKGNIYLAKVTRVEPSLQAAFVEYGGNRHGFLAFSEIHPDYYRLPVDDRTNSLMPVDLAPGGLAPGGLAPGGLAPESVSSTSTAAMPTPENSGNRSETGPEPVQDASPVETVETAKESAPSPDGETAEGAAIIEPPVLEAAAAPTALGSAEALGTEEPGAKRPETETSATEEHTQEAPIPETGGQETVSAKTPTANPQETGVTIVGEAFGESVQENAPSPADPTPLADSASGKAQPNGTPPADEPAPGASGKKAWSTNKREREKDKEKEDVDDVGGDDADDFAPQHLNPYRSFKIQEVIKRRQIMLVQVVKEERGNKGAALTTYLSLAGRYCVLMPNTPKGGGISRKITNAQDRKRLKGVLEELDLVEGMAVIVRTAGAERSKAEIKRDYDYLLRLWDSIRRMALQSAAPVLIHEEGNLIKRSIRDLYQQDIEEVLVAGQNGYRTAKDFMKMLIPSHAKRVQHYKEETIPLFHRYQVENQLDAIHSPVVQLRSGGYIVINPTEALVAIDVNSGKATRERHIEETAQKTNLEAADEVARQLRLRDLAGLIVIDFIDMEESRNQHAVERRLKEAMRHDRARIQLGRISPFGLLEMSRQRLRPSLLEASTEICPHCSGTGTIRSIESTALHVLRAIEEEGVRRRSSAVTVYVPPRVAMFILNQKRQTLYDIENRYGLLTFIDQDETLVPPNHRLEREAAQDGDDPVEVEDEEVATRRPAAQLDDDTDSDRRNKRRRKRRRPEADLESESDSAVAQAEGEEASPVSEERETAPRSGRRPNPEKIREPEVTATTVAAGAGHGPETSPATAPATADETKRAGGDTLKKPSGQEKPSGTDEKEGATNAADSQTADTENDDAAGKSRRRRRGKRGGRRRRRTTGDMQQEAAPTISEEQPLVEWPLEIAALPQPIDGAQPLPDPALTAFPFPNAPETFHDHRDTINLAKAASAPQPTITPSAFGLPGEDGGAYGSISPPPVSGTADPVTAGSVPRDPALPDPALPDPALPDPALPDPALPDPALPDPALPDPALPNPVIPGRIIPEPETGGPRTDGLPASPPSFADEPSADPAFADEPPADPAPSEPLADTAARPQPSAMAPPPSQTQTTISWQAVPDGSAPEAFAQEPSLPNASPDNGSNQGPDAETEPSLESVAAGAPKPMIAEPIGTDHSPESLANEPLATVSPVQAAEEEEEEEDSLPPPPPGTSINLVTNKGNRPSRRGWWQRLME